MLLPLALILLDRSLASLLGLRLMPLQLKVFFQTFLYNQGNIWSLSGYLKLCLFYAKVSGSLKSDSLMTFLLKVPAAMIRG